MRRHDVRRRDQEQLVGKPHVPRLGVGAHEGAEGFRNHGGTKGGLLVAVLGRKEEKEDATGGAAAAVAPTENDGADRESATATPIR